MATLRVSPAAHSAAAPATSSRTSGPAAHRSVAAPAEPIFATLRLAFYNVGLQTAQLQPTAPRWTEYMSRLCNDVRRIFSDIPDLAILHLCEEAMGPACLQQCGCACKKGAPPATSSFRTTMFFFGARSWCTSPPRLHSILSLCASDPVLVTVIKNFHWKEHVFKI